MAADAEDSDLELTPSEGGPPKYEEYDGRRESAGAAAQTTTPVVRRSEDALNESSPLLSPKSPQSPRGDGNRSRRNGTATSHLEWKDGDAEESKSMWYLFLLTLSIGGLQVAWAVELSNGSPYLLSLGMSKSLLAIVWIAGPLTGTLVQPYVGIRSDNCRSSWGKRAPFMAGGAAATIVSLMALAWTREIVQGFLGLFGADPNSNGVKVVAIIFATISVYALDFAINTVQAGIRAFICDNAPTHQQEDANAWAGRLTGVGNILGYLSGYVDLPRYMWFFGDTQFKVLCVLASLALGITILISCLYVRERDPRADGEPAESVSGVLAFFAEVFASMKRLSPQIRKVCEAQFFNWIGWFPFLFYITTYIGQLQVNPYFAANPDLSHDEIERAWEDATRVGAFALLIFAITSFLSNVFLPFIVVPTYRPPQQPLTSSFHSSRSHNHLDRPSTPTTHAALSTSGADLSPAPSAGSHSRLARLLSAFQIRWLTLRRAWLLSHILFAICMFSTFFIRSTTVGIIFVGVIGLPWALTTWAPFALISAEISKQETARRARVAGRGSSGDLLAASESKAADQAGVVLGLHNVAISAPQIIATLVSSIIFQMVQKRRGAPNDDSVGWVLRFGGLAALVAAYMTSRVGEEAETARGSRGVRELDREELGEEV